MRRTALLAFASFLGAAAPAEAALRNINVDLESGPGTDFAQRIGVAGGEAELERLIRNEIESAFQLYRIDDYLRSFADAQAFTTKGLGADYASNIDYFMIGAAANVALNADRAYLESGRGDPAVQGLTTNVTIMGGVNLGLIGAKPITIYGNFFKGKGSYSDFSTDIDNYGAHVQIKLFGPGRETVLSSIVRWGGLDITTGFDFARQTLSLAQSQQLDRSVPVGDPRFDARVRAEATGNFKMNLSTWTIPLELTTNLRLLRIASVYGGLGFDWQLGGKAEMEIDISGDVVGSIPGQNINDQRLGTATVTATGDTSPSKARLRALAGVQFNILMVKLFTQLNYSPELETASVAFGARVAY